MLINVIRLLFTIVSAGAIAAFVSTPSLPPLFETHRFPTFVVLMLLTQSVIFIDVLIPRKRIEVISAVYFGLLIGFLLSSLTYQALQPVVTDQFKGVTLL